MGAAPDSASIDNLTGGYSGRMLGLIATCTVISTVGWLVIPPLLPKIIDDLAITGTQAGFAITVLTALSALGRYPGGRFADQLSRKTVLVFSLLSWICGFVVLAGATNYGLLLLGVTLVGLGLGTFFPTAFAYLSDLFVKNRGLAFGINDAAFNLGGIVASGLAIVVFILEGWRLAFLPIIALLVPLLLLLHVWSKEPYAIGRVELDVVLTVKLIILDKQILALLIISAIFSFAWNGSVTFLPTFLEAERGVTATLASIAYATVFVAGVFSTPLAGTVGDRIGRLPTVAIALLFATGGLFIVMLMPGTLGVILGVIVFGLGITGFWPVMTAYIISVFPDEHKAGDYGALSTIFMGVGSIGPTFVGSVGEQFSFTAAYVGIALSLLVCLGVVWWLKTIVPPKSATGI